MQNVEQWGCFEYTAIGPQSGNPFIDVTFEAKLQNAETQVRVNGFYDGSGKYIIRYMPEILGDWKFVTESNVSELNGLTGEFKCIKTQDINNHGPVKVVDKFHFLYEDGTYYYPFGTTCYAWIHQSEEMQQQTIKTLSTAGFNKIRMCVFPKFYSNNSNEPLLYPFEGTAPDKWDFTRFNPEFFRHLEKQILKLQELGIEADVILFHPYDKGHWGFDRMGKENDDRYLRYIVSRLAAYRNVWWSMANEFDYVKSKTMDDWKRLIQIVVKNDYYGHLLGVHNADIFFDNWMPEITHSSIQLGTKDTGIPLGFGTYKILREVYQKATIIDEAGYEGDLMQRWGSLTPQEVIDKYWKAIVSGVYMSHGETYSDPDERIWWAKGGVLKGQAVARIMFLKKIVEESKLPGLDPIDRQWILNGVGKHAHYYLYYLGEYASDKWKFALPAFKVPEEIEIGTKFKVEIIDTWNMTITEVPQKYEITDKDRYNYYSSKTPYVKLPGKKYIALRITKEL